MSLFLVELKLRNEPLYFFGVACLLAAIVCVLLLWVKPMLVLGVNGWFKPFKFFLSTTIFVWSMAWFTHYLPNEAQVRYYSWCLIALFTAENLYIVIQAARGTTSHFNVSAPLASSLWTLMAFAAVGISFATAVIGWRFFVNGFPELPPAYLWGIRLGLIVFVIFSLEGLAMGARMAHTVGAPDGGPGLPLVNWSTRHGDLRVAHFFGMHALQVLPLLGFYVIKDVRLMIALGIGYAVVVVVLFTQALAGKPFLMR